MYQIVKL